MSTHYSASHSFTLRARLDDRPGSFADLARAIADAGGLLDAIDLVRVDAAKKIRDISVFATDARACRPDRRRVRRRSGRRGRAGLRPHLPAPPRRQDPHELELAGQDARRPLDGLHAGRRARLPAIAADPDSAWNLTIKRNTVAVVTDGSAVLGLGDIGPEAAMPVMEGKALLFKEFGGIDAWPLCLATKDTDEIVATVQAIAPGFGGINLEDIAAPRCFEVEDRLRASLDIPVFHDDQHGTAIVVLAAFLNALRVVDKRIEDVKVVVTGVGAAGIAVTRTLQAAGVRNVIGCDSVGAVYRGRRRPDRGEGALRRGDESRERPRQRVRRARRRRRVPRPLAAECRQRRGDQEHGEGRDRLRDGESRPPRSSPEEIEGHVAVIATGRSDYPNQINNVLAFPGVFRARSTSARGRSPSRWRSPPATRSPRRSARTSSPPTTSSRASSTATSCPPSRARSRARPRRTASRASSASPRD